MTIYDELVERGLIAQVTDENEIKELINNGKAVFYIGFDPTADSLHVGHFMALCLMKRLQQAGNKPIALVGGGTGMIGDPSGRTDLRKVLTVEDIDHNCECFKKQMSKFIEFGDGKAMMVNNADWLRSLNYIEFLRDVGPHFSVNRMLTAECYKQRMENGLTFLEFNYMIMQAFDFYSLYNKYGCNMQFGGDDQWSNMLAGTELIRRKMGKDAYAMTITLLMNSEGKKMGKTANGAVWLDPNKTTPYDFYQYWRNVDDGDVIKCLKLLTFLPLDEINEMATWKDQKINEAKSILAYELTKLVHGEEEAKKCDDAAKAIFSGSMNTADMPRLEISDSDFVDDKIELSTILVKSKFCQSKGDARRTIEQGGVTIDDEKVVDIKCNIEKEKLTGDGIVVKKGKKNFIRVVLTSIMFVMLLFSHAFATEIINTSEVIANDISKDIHVTFADDKCVEYNNIIDPYTGQKVDGYIFKDNTVCKLAISNLNAIARPFNVLNYYYSTYDGQPIKVTNKESKMFSGDIYQIIPDHTYQQLKNANRVDDRLFVLECEFEVINNDLLYYFQNAASLSEIEKYEMSKLNFYIDDEGRMIERKKSNVYFQLVDDSFFDEYVSNLKNKKIDNLK